MKKFISAAICTAMLFCLAGCEQKESDTVTEFEAAPPFSPLTEIKEGRKNIYLIIKTLNSDYWDVVVDGAKAGVQVCATATQTINERLAGFLQYWSNNAPDNWTVISDIKFNEGDVDRGCQCTEDLLNNYPDIKGVFGSDNVSTTSLAATIKKKERTDIVVVGFDYSSEIASLINSDEYTASSVLQRQFNMSYDGVKTALDLIDGEKMEQKFVDTGITVVNSNNRNSPEVRETLDHNRG